MELSCVSESLYRFGSRTIPAIGLGTYKLKGSKGLQAIKYAIQIGYRLIDTAHLYENEDIVGVAVRESIQEGIIKSREDIFITTKLATVNHDPSRIKEILQFQNQRLGLEYIDLLLIHAPWGQQIMSEEEKNNYGIRPLYKDDIPVPNYFDHNDMWKEMEKCVKLGFIRHIGLSNFDNTQVQSLLDNSTIKPFNNQVEIHPWVDQEELVKFHFENNISVTSFMSLGRANRSSEHGGNLLENEKLHTIARKYDVSIAQLLLKYQLQRNICVIPKSETPERILENSKVFHFQITKEDMNEIKKLNKNQRSCNFLDNKNNPGFPTSWPKQ